MEKKILFFIQRRRDHGLGMLCLSDWPMIVERALCRMFKETPIPRSVNNDAATAHSAFVNARREYKVT